MQQETTAPVERNLLKSTTLVASLTMLSRVLGFIRDMVIAHTFGAAMGVDAFLVAFKIPNFMRRLFAEGAFSQAFVPVLSEYQQQQDKEHIQAFISHIAGNLGLVLMLVTVLAEIITPVLIAIFAPGFIHDSGRFGLATEMLRVTFPYLMFISLTAFAGAILNTYGNFAVPAFTPVLLNISMICAAYFLSPHLAEPVTALSWGVLLAGIVQLSFQLPFLYRLHLLPRPRINWRDEGVNRVLKLMVPALFGVSVAQVSLLVDTIFASFLQVGSVSWLYYSDRLSSFPLGVFGVAIATVVLPNLSRKHAKQSTKSYSATLDWAIRAVLIIGVPAGLGLLILAGPLLTTLLQYGKFNAFDVHMAQRSLWAFAVGVPGFMFIKVLASGFYAKQNVKTPVKYAVIAMVTNMLLNLLLVFPLAHAGLALATALSSSLNSALLFWGLRKRGIFIPQPGWLKFAGQLCLANGAMALLLCLTTASLPTWLEWAWYQRASHLAMLVIGSVLVYGLTLQLCGVRIRHFLRNPTEEDTSCN